VSSTLVSVCHDLERKKRFDLPMARSLPDWIDGLRFECTRCGRCCEAPGYVWISAAEVQALAGHLRLSLDDFGRRFLRLVGSRLSLLEKPDGRCIFLGDDRRCSVYALRPRQCRTFPFWRAHLATREAWAAVEAACPGAGAGILHSRTEIEHIISSRPSERP
jgi:Fe-S-cluster containining protein